MTDITTERWKSIDFAPDYDVSDRGRMRFYRCRNGKGRMATGQIMKLDYSGDYPRIRLRFDGRRVAFTIHSLVAKAFVPNPENKPTINHKDGNKANNVWTNLEWATYSEQMAHAREIGLIVGPTRRALSDEQITELRQRRAEGMSTPKLAALFKVSQGTVWKCLAGWTKYAMALG